jgi:hypothetical protein
MMDHAKPADGQDWLAFLAAHAGRELPEIELKNLATGDVLIVETKNTRYAFRWHAHGDAELATNRGDERPRGRVRIHGCAFGQSSSIKPGALFCGGNMEYVSQGGKITHRTTVIRSLELLRRRVMVAK